MTFIETERALELAREERKRLQQELDLCRLALRVALDTIEMLSPSKPRIRREEEKGAPFMEEFPPDIPSKERV